MKTPFLKSVLPANLIAVSTILLMNSSLLMAGTVVEIKNKNEISTVKTDGKQARMDMDGDEYVIVNYADSSVRVVSPGKQQVMLLSVDDMPKGGTTAPNVQTRIKKLGSGPDIAGYSTDKFSYTVNGKSCGIIYGSKNAFNLKGIKDMFDAMRTMAERQRSMMGGYAAMIDECTQGQFEVSDHVATIGVPMRIENRGVVDSEVRSIKVDVDLPANTFSIPSSYKTVTVKEEMQKASQDMDKIKKQMQQYQPQVQQMMQQMQQSGQMPPEVMERMRQMQQQYQ